MIKERYHGWQLEFVRESAGYSFQCWLPSDRIAVSDRKIYSTIDSARNAAQAKADLEAVKWALKHCYASYIHGNLSSDEFSTLEDLIVGVLTPERHSGSLSSQLAG